MLTKTQFCKSIIHDFKINENIKDIDDNKLENYICKSSSLCVALEYLGLLKDKQSIKYANTRGGTLFIYSDCETKEIETLSTRELLSFLPETLEEK